MTITELLIKYVYPLLGTLLTAAVGFAVAWLRARTTAFAATTEARRQAALGAITHAELEARDRPMSGMAKKSFALSSMATRLPSRMQADSKADGSIIEHELPGAPGKFPSRAKAIDTTPKDP